MDFIELNLCDKVGKILIEAKKLYTGSSFCMFLKWMASDIFNEIIIGNSIYCSQAKTYVARCFIMEVGSSDDTNLPSINDDALHWIGYLMTYWCFSFKLTPSYLLEHYDIASIVNAYPTLHTLSIKMAISKIQEDYAI